jgi:hypothetical protein
MRRRMRGAAAGRARDDDVVVAEGQPTAARDTQLRGSRERRHSDPVPAVPADGGVDAAPVRRGPQRGLDQGLQQVERGRCELGKQGQWPLTQREKRCDLGVGSFRPPTFGHRCLPLGCRVVGDAGCPAHCLPAAGRAQCGWHLDGWGIPPAHRRRGPFVIVVRQGDVPGRGQPECRPPKLMRVLVGGSVSEQSGEDDEILGPGRRPGQLLTEPFRGAEDAEDGRVRGR